MVTGDSAMAADDSVAGAAKPAKKRRKAPVRKPRAESSSGVSSKTLAYAVAGLVVVYLLYSYNNSGKPSADTGGVNPAAAVKPVAGDAIVHVIVLNDKRCGASCDVSNIMRQLGRMLPNMTVRELDVGSQDGIGLFKDAGLEVLPAILFDRTVKDAAAYPQIAGYLEVIGGMGSLKIGANWDPYCDPAPEHCGEARCEGRLSCRAETPGVLEAYVMSECPYGILALNSMREVLAAFNGTVDFRAHYIGGVDNATGKPLSLHGEGEVAEDIRGLCAMKQDSDAYMRYVWCRNKDVKSQDWTACATDAHLDAGAMKSCSEGDEGKQLLLDDFRYARQLRIVASPTFLINGKYMFNAVSAADIQAGICGKNPGLAGCAAKLSNSTAANAGAG